MKGNNMIDLLIKGIIRQAVTDYVGAYRRNAKIINKLQECDLCYEKRQYYLYRKRMNDDTMESIENFFHSQYYQGMCSIDGNKMIKLTREKAKECLKVP